MVLVCFLAFFLSFDRNKYYKNKRFSVRTHQSPLLSVAIDWWKEEFYPIKDCPATNNALENFYSTSLKNPQKKAAKER